MSAEHRAAINLAASQFELADAELLAARSLEQRRDWKFVMSEAVLAELLPLMRSSYRVLPAGGELLAQYETYYYDTEDLHCYREHRRGRSRRHKLRVRSYLDRNVTMLEVKSRDARRMTEKHYLQREFGDLTISDEAAQQFIVRHSGLPPETLGHSLNNSFRRITLLGVERPERITLDVQMKFHVGEAACGLPGVVVAEVKSANSRTRTDVLRLFRSARLRPLGFSKYCLGTALLNEGLRANRFLPTLRQVSRLEEAS